MSEKRVDIDEVVEECCTVFRRRQIEGSLPCAKKTLDVLRLIVTCKKHTSAAALIDEIRNVGYKMQTARPVELAIGNMVRRVLHLIREEEAQLVAKQKEDEDSKPSSSQPALVEFTRSQAGLLSQQLKGRASQMARGPSLSNLLDVGIDALTFSSTLAPIAESLPAAEGRLEGMERAGGAGGQQPDYEAESAASTRRHKKGAGQEGGAKKPERTTNWRGKHEVIESINELIDELDTIQGAITNQGLEHIHANEVILTMGMSDTTYAFLKEVSKKREFQVVVAEGAPRYDGHLMARRLADAGIQTTLIADTAVYAMMARANKVLVGAHAVLANGGVVAPVGMHLVALAARRHSIPFVVLVGLHKLSPLFPTDPDLLYNEFKGPVDVIDFGVVGEAFAQQQQLHLAALAAAPSAQTPSSGGAGDASAAPADAPAAAPGPPPLGPSHWQQPAPSAAAAVCGGSPPLYGSGGAAGGAGPLRWDPMAGNVHVPTPLFDYVPPQLISLFITDNGGRTPSYVYRLLTEYYTREDYFLSREVFAKDGSR